MAENEKQTNKERLKDITNSIERWIQDLFQSDKYAEYLRTMSRFHKYSIKNTMLIYMQKPDSTLGAVFNKCRDQFERNLMKGEKGIKIIAPTPFKKKIEQEKRDPDTNLPMLDADGKVITEEKEIKIPMFKPVTAFDVSETDGKPLAQKPPTFRKIFRTTRSLWKPCGALLPFPSKFSLSVMAQTAISLCTRRKSLSGGY